MKLELHHLKLLLAIVEDGSLTKAGHRLHLTQSALSHQLRAAEERLGTQLFLRLPHKMVLTPAGEKLVAVARSVLGELQCAEDEIRQLMRCHKAVLRICNQFYTSYHWLHRALRCFSPEFPDVEVKIILEATQEPVRALMENKLDVAMVPGCPNDRRLASRKMFEDQLMVFMHREHPLASRPYVTGTDFAKERIIAFTDPTRGANLDPGLLSLCDVKVNEIQQLELTEAIIEKVKAGLGITVLPRWSVEPQMDSGQLCAVPLTKEGTWKEWYAVTVRSRFQLPYVKGFVDLICHQSRACGRATLPRTPSKIIGHPALDCHSSIKRRVLRKT